MDLPLTPEAKVTNASPQILPPHSQILHQKFQKVTDPTPKSLIVDRLEALLQMQKKMSPSAREYPNAYPMEKPLSMKWIFLHMSEAYSTNMSLIQVRNSLLLVIPKSWKYNVLVEDHDKLGHQGNTCTYCLMKWQYYWKGMNKDIRKYIANCTLCCREKSKVQAYPFQMMEISDGPFDKIAIRFSHRMQNLQLWK